MPEASATIRIFISSPGDVVEERDQARKVILGLQKLYPDVTLQPVLWEDLALPATASFQESIDFILEREPIDVAVFVLWSRLGTPLGASTTRPDGTPYRSGTEREFDLMLAAFEQSEHERPVILAYTRDDDAGFKRKLTESPNSELEELIAQRRLTESFIREQFFDAEGHNIRAVQSFREPAGFAQRLRVHLRQALDEMLKSETGPRWLDDPYRGLKVFDIEHAPIFHGRDEETCELLQRLRDQERAGCAFVVIVGASGSGKSSLARAGVAASLVAHAGDEGVRQWRTAFFTPSLGGSSVVSELARTLVEALPELRAAGIDCEKIAAGLAKDPALTVELSIEPAFHRAGSPLTPESGQSTPDARVRLLFVLDQMEELWTDRHITDEHREKFLIAIDAMASSGYVAVLGTLRSDFYPQAQQMPEFLRLKGERGHYDLLPPSATAVGRLITEPARLAGLKFERDEEAGRSLDEVIANDAARNPGALPLLQYALDELYRQRDDNSGLLTFVAYERLGGVEGALGKRAEEVFAALPIEAQDAFGELMALLVTVDVTGDFTAVRRRAPLTELTATPTRKALTTGLIEDRLLTTGRTGGDYVDARVEADIGTVPVGDIPIASLAHETLLSNWRRLSVWVSENSEYLRLRSRVGQSQKRWEQYERNASLLLPSGLPLEEARQLLSEAAHMLSPDTWDYIEASFGFHDRRTRNERRRLRAITTFLATLAVLAIVGASFAWFKHREAITQRGFAKSVEKQKQRAERQLYFSQFYRALAKLESERHGQATAMLETTPIPMRRWESRYLARRAAGTPLTLRGHADDVNTVCFSSNGQQIASGSDDMTVRVWDPRAGKETLTLRGHAGPVNSVCFSPNGQQIASGSDDMTVRVWDHRTGEESLTLRGHSGPVNSVCFSPNGQQIASGSDDLTLRVWDARSGEKTLTLRGHAGPVNTVCFSPDGQQIVSGDGNPAAGHLRSQLVMPGQEFDGNKIEHGNEVKLWDATRGEELATLGRHADDVSCVRFSPDGRRIVSGSDDGTVTLWNASSGEQTVEFDGYTGVTSVGFSPDGTRIVSAYMDETVKLWDASSAVDALDILRGPSPLFTGRGHTGYVNTACYSPDGTQIVSGGYDGTIKVWDTIGRGDTLTLRGHADAVSCVRFSSDGRRVVSSSDDGTIIVWNASGVESLRFNGSLDWVTTVAFSPDGTRIVSGTGDTVTVWDSNGGEQVLSFSRHSRPVTCVCFSPDGQWVASGSEDETVLVWNSSNGEGTFTLRGHTGPVNTLCFSLNGGQIVSGSNDKTVKVWDTRTGEETLTLDGHTDSVRSVCFSPDGQQIVSGSDDGTVRVWDTRSGEETLTLDGHTGSVRSVCFSPDGTRIVSGGLDDTVKVWAISGEELLTLNGHTGNVNSVCVSPDGTRIVSAGTDKTVKFWDAASGEEILRLRGHTSEVTSVNISRDGTLIVSDDQRGHEIVWSAATGEPVQMERPSETLPAGHVNSIDPKLRIFKSGRDVLLVIRNPEATDRLWEEETARRAAQTPSWHEHNAAKAEVADDWFAARFHLRRLNELSPDDKSVNARLEHAEAMLGRDALESPESRPGLQDSESAK